jgi:hypothetical protein
MEESPQLDAAVAVTKDGDVPPWSRTLYHLVQPNLSIV